MKLKVTFAESESIAATKMYSSDQQFNSGLGGGTWPVYNGEYEVTPNDAEQTLHTARRSMAKDVTIHAIPYYEVDNEYNGQTILIGGN